MIRIKSRRRMTMLLGYGWALLAVAVSITGFINNERLGAVLANRTGIRIAENLSGGETGDIQAHEGYLTIVHKPVFTGVWGALGRGFVQIDWLRYASFPRVIMEAIDYDLDGRPDFRVRLDTVRNTGVLEAYSPAVGGIRDHEVFVYGNQSRTIRVNLRRR